MKFSNLFYEPTDVPVAAKPFQCSTWRSLKFISPNLNELKHIAKVLGVKTTTESSDPIIQATQIGKEVSKYIDNLLITLGPLGLIIIRKAEASDSFLNPRTNIETPQIRYYKTEEIQDLVNVSGAGDCLASGIMSAMLKGKSEATCVSVGFAAAKMALHCKSAVPNVLFDDSHFSWNQEAKFIQL